jgi:antitoxin component of MazEF toxin-antitoxin module
VRFVKTVVMRTGAGIAIPLPGRLAEQLRLAPGTKVEVEGPDAEGGLRIVPIRTGRTPATSDSVGADPPTGPDVVAALTRRRPAAADPETSEDLTRELDGLVTRHADALREVTP